MDEKIKKLDHFGRYPPELCALALIFVSRTGIASQADKESMIRLEPTDEQWKKIEEILNLKVG